MFTVFFTHQRSMATDVFPASSVLLLFVLFCFFLLAATPQGHAKSLAKSRPGDQQPASNQRLPEWLFLYSNASPHKTRAVTQYVEWEKYKSYRRTPYSPTLHYVTSGSFLSSLLNRQLNTHPPTHTTHTQTSNFTCHTNMYFTFPANRQLHTPH